MTLKHHSKLVLLFCLLSTISITAQEETNTEEKEKTPVKMRIKGGYSLGKLSGGNDNVYTKDYESTDGGDFVVSFEFQVNDLISIQPEINITKRGGKRNGFQPVVSDELSSQLNQFLPVIGLPEITADNPMYATYNSKSVLNYLEIPALVKFGVGEDFRVFAEVGPYVGILLNAKQITSGRSQFFLDADGMNPVVVPNPSGNPQFVPLPEQSLDAETDTKDDLRTVNFGGIFGIGISKKVNANSEFFMDARASYSLNAIQIKEDYGQSHIGGVIFSVGYAFYL